MHDSDIQTDAHLSWCDEERVHHIGYTAAAVMHDAQRALTSLLVSVHFPASL